MIEPLQVVLLAGGIGQRMYPLTEKFPKALLPIGNKPMIAYQLEMLERNGFQNVLVLMNDSNKLENYLKNEIKTKLKIQFHTIPQDGNSLIDTLVDAQEKIQRDFMVVCCDTLTDLNFDEFYRFHLEKEATISIFLRQNEQEKDKKKSKNDQDEYDIVILDDKSQRILQICSNFDAQEEGIFLKKAITCRYLKLAIIDVNIQFQNNCSVSFFKLTNKYILRYFGGDILIRNQLYDKNKLIIIELNISNNTIYQFYQNIIQLYIQNQLNIIRYPQATFHSNFFDSHIYIFNHKIIAYLKSTQNKFQNLKEDLIPFIIKNQFNKKLIEQFFNESENSDDVIPLITLQQSTEIRVFGYIEQLTYTKRVYDLVEYMAANQDFLSNQNICQQVTINNENLIKTTGTSFQDSCIAEGTQLGQNIIISKSIIGKNCVIGDNSRIANSIIMHNSIIDTDCIVQNSIISTKVKIGAKCNIKNLSYVGHNCIIEPSSKLDNDISISQNNM